MRKLGFFALAAALGAGAAPACDDIVTRAKANLADLITDRDYPAAARAARQQGVVHFTLDVAPSGRVTGCTVTRSSGSAALDGTTCRVMRARALFTPAYDAGGNAIPDKVAARIGWKLPPAPAR